MNDKIAKIVAKIKAMRGDPVEFCRTILGIELHPGQQRWVNESVERQNILVTGNRWGKSEVTAAKKIWECAYRVGWDSDMIARYDARRQPYHVVNVAPTADQANIVWHKARSMLMRPTADFLVSKVVEKPFPRITFRNGAIFEARTTAKNGAYLEGANYDRLSWDEVALEKKFLLIRDGTLQMRLLDRRGRMDLVSTGKGRNDFGNLFMRAREGKEPGTYSQHGSTFENPFVPADEVAALKALLGGKMGRQNIDGEIVDDDGGFFSIEDILAAEKSELTDCTRYETVDGIVRRATVMPGYTKHGDDQSNGVPWYVKHPGHRYVHFWDVADKQDFMVGFTLDTSGEKLVVVEFERFNGLGWARNYEIIRDRHRRYQIGVVGDDSHSGSRTIIDQTGVGDAVVEALTDIAAEGFVFTKQSKDDVLTGLQSTLSLRELEMPQISVVYDELKFYERDDKDLVQDCVMALAGAVHFGRRRPVPSFAFGF